MKQSQVSKKAVLTQTKTAIVYVDPRFMDIKCGQGSINYQHPGNQNLRALIGPEVESYERSETRRGKTAIIRKIACAVYKQGGRFLKYDKHAKQWYDGGFHTAKNRVGTAFRDAVILRKKEALARRSINAVDEEEEDAGSQTKRVYTEEQTKHCLNSTEENYAIHEAQETSRSDSEDLAITGQRSNHDYTLSNQQSTDFAVRQAALDQAHRRLLAPCASLPWWVSSQSMVRLWTSMPQQSHAIFVHPRDEHYLPIPSNN